VSESLVADGIAAVAAADADDAAAAAAAADSVVASAFAAAAATAGAVALATLFPLLPIIVGLFDLAACLREVDELAAPEEAATSCRQSLSGRMGEVGSLAAAVSST